MFRVDPAAARQLWFRKTIEYGELLADLFGLFCWVDPRPLHPNRSQGVTNAHCYRGADRCVEGTDLIGHRGIKHYVVGFV